MKLTLQIKLLPTQEHFTFLKNTLVEANTACNEISDTAFTKKLYNQYKLHHETYHRIKNSFNLSAQMVVRSISKVTDAYKLDKKVKREFRLLGAITYDARILSYVKEGISMWTVGGRIKIPFVCHNQKYIPYIKGEADLVFKKGKFYLFQTVEVPEEEIKDVESFIGCDFGLLDICTMSNGRSFNSQEITEYREQRQKVRSSLQRKGTKGCKKALKRLSGREKRTNTIINHTISKQIVQLAKSEGKGIAIEDLKGIRFSANKKGKKFRTKVGKWSFDQLRQFLTYKSLLNGVKLVSVPPAYTSKTCSTCYHIGNRVGKSFKCNNCGNDIDADFNASKNIALLGMNVSHPEIPSMLYCQVHRS